MKLAARLWTTFTHILSTLTGNPFEEAGQGLRQYPILPESHPHVSSTPVRVHTPASVHTPAPVKELHDGYDKPGPIFTPPSGDGSGFTCDYSAMTGWEECSTSSDRGCWLKNPTIGTNFSINTDYESAAGVPIGITREYHMFVGPNNTVNLDGQVFDAGKLFRLDGDPYGSYPGPWIQACWGDTVQVTVTVDEATNEWYNGTAVHWHGIRQWLTMHMDGVPGITQCPIAPGSSFTYKWRARQYGSSWYHSHYTLQYADGLAGALVSCSSYLFISLSEANFRLDHPRPQHVELRRGGSTSSLDDGMGSVLTASTVDTNTNQRHPDHTSAFILNYNSSYSDNPTVLLNGVGDVNKTYGDVVPVGLKTPTTLVFEPGKKYLLRIINISMGTSFLFTIDNHVLTVVSADFVPIIPYTTESINVAIGQRYNVIVEATPTSGSGNPLPTDNINNFWIRTYFLSSETLNNTGRVLDTYQEVGIVRYTTSTSSDDPSSSPWNPNYQNLPYADETGLTPWFPWFVGNQSNVPSSSSSPTPPGPVPEEHDVYLDITATAYPVAAFAIATPTPTPVVLTPFRIDWQNITFENLDNTGDWPKPWVMVAEDGTPDQWVCANLNAPGHCS